MPSALRIRMRYVVKGLRNDILALVSGLHQPPIQIIIIPPISRYEFIKTGNTNQRFARDKNKAINVLLPFLCNLVIACDKGVFSRQAITFKKIFRQ